MSKTVIHTDQAPAAIGAYSQAIRTGNTVYLSGQIPLVPETMQLVSENFEEQATEKLGTALANLDERSQDIIKARWLDDDKTTLHDLAAKYNVSAERIRQLEANALKKLKSAVDF